MVTANKVAKLLLSWARQNGDVITNLKLQKLLYYAQAWYLVNFDRRLFSDPIQAWDFGPVIPPVYHRWKEYQSSPIPYKVRGNEQADFQKHQVDFLKEFYRIFSSFSATALVSMTHAESPWKDAHAEGQNTEILPFVMKKYYRERYAREHGGA